MNLYIRFFNDETLVRNIEEATDFLMQATNGQVEPQTLAQLADYINSSTPYPRRFKVRTRIYFIVIKTPAETMEEFKARGQQMQEERQAPAATADEVDEGRAKVPFDACRPGWYEAELTFKRVLFNEAKGKNEYIDTAFAARLKAHSVKEAYDTVCNYLMSREDIDKRSQMPSIKGRNFNCRYLGLQAQQ